MAGKEGLGRVFNVVPIASGVAISLRDATAITYVCTGADTFTLTASPTFGGSYTSPGALINHYYQAVGTTGTTAWTRVAQTAANTVVQAGANTTVISILDAMLPDPDVYVKLTASGSGLVCAITHDLEIQRRATNLSILSA